ncbi:DUF2142 domain-containing protein [Arthrobacter sp. zg-Y750]|uniref:DUF2142 domain-containing protein n=1 Tax=Arthrobacter sp. zg-Y750 TaxID=2894189 RepID=UPI001E5D8BAF|nr:DUF2142 domain-containing protein [Arthrobacter sp. zg-Y750]
MHQKRPHASRPKLSFPVVFAILGLLTTIWSLASPLLSVPDEDAHVVRAASVARGQLIGIFNGQQSEKTVVNVPRYLAHLDDGKCYEFKAWVTADCAPPLDATDNGLEAAGTSAGNYNPIYYLVAGLPTLFLSGAPAVYGMRILSGLLCAALLASTMCAAGQLRKPKWPFAAALVALTPMVLFLSGSVNPNALEIAAAAAVFMNLCVVLENHPGLTAVRLNILMVAVSGALLANTRPVSLMWLLLAVAAAVFSYGYRPLGRVLADRFSQAMIAVLGAGCLLSLLWLVKAQSFKSLVGEPLDIDPSTAAAIMLDRTFDYATGYIGFMGWLDTRLPSGIYIFWYFTMAVVLLAGITSRPVRGRWGIYLLIIAAVAVPPLMQAKVVQELGWIWQGRYLLALIVVLLLACGVALRFKPFPKSLWARSAAKWLLATAVAVHTYAFVYVLRRYTVGLDEMVRWKEMLDPAWQPPGTWQGLTLAYLMVMAAGAVLAYRYLFLTAKQPVLTAQPASPGRHAAVSQ